MTSIIRNHDLAAAGQKKIAWVEHYMPTLNNIGERLKKEQTFQDKTVVVSVHLEAKTAYLALVLHRAGAKVVVTGSNPLSTQDDVAAALVAEGLTVYATYNCTEEEYFSYLNAALDHKPHIIIDDGKILIENCKKSGLSAHDVAFKLRTNGIFSSDDVKRAIVEQNGQLIIIRSGEENPKFPIITDGQVQYDILSVIGKDEEWLLEELKKRGIEKYSDVFLGEYVNKQLKLTTY